MERLQPISSRDTSDRKKLRDRFPWRKTVQASETIREVREPGYYVHSGDWPHVPGPDLTSEQIFAVLSKIDTIFEPAMKELRETPITSKDPQI